MNVGTVDPALLHQPGPVTNRDEATLLILADFQQQSITCPEVTRPHVDKGPRAAARHLDASQGEEQSADQQDSGGHARSIGRAGGSLKPGPRYVRAVLLAPAAASQRLQSLDILRGLALIGVLIENMQHFVSPTYAAYLTWPAAGELDRIVVWCIRFACENKVYLLFAFFFGYSGALQMLKAEATEASFTRLYAWRMLTLFLIGIVNTAIWRGDILLTYALLGFTLLLLRHLSRKSLLGIVAISMAIPSIWMNTSGADPEMISEFIYPIRQTAFAFAMFALGLVGGRANWFADAPALLRRTRPWLPALLLLALAANIVFAIYFDRQNTDPASWVSLATEVCAALGTPSLAALYVLGTLWVLERPAGRRCLRSLGDLGRMTLTHYLLQSIIGMGLIHTLANHLPGPITPPMGVVLSVVILAGQIALSVWWLRRHRFGPVEWFWRSATYGRRLPLRIAD